MLHAPARAVVRAIVLAAAFLGVGEAGSAGQFTDAELRSALISMTRENRCGFGQQDPTDIRQCPNYFVSIAGDGTVRYARRNGVRTLGKRTHQTAVEAVHKLVVELERSAFFQLKERYEQVQVGDVIQTIDHAIRRDRVRGRDGFGEPAP